jgi:dipeptidyl aminopeptidase/acylaminoacyl peptidase
VLFLHGLPGAEKNVDIQRVLQARGIGSFAPHFAGAWGSGGEYRISTLVEQARTALAFMKKRPFVDPRRVAVLGFSMGGWTALNLAGKTKGLRGVAALAPAGGPEMIGPSNPEVMARLSATLNAPPVSELTSDFRRAVTRQNPHESVKRLTCPLLLVHGDADDTIPCGVSKLLDREATVEHRFVLAKGARHDFLDRRSWLARLTADWLIQRLTA